MKEEPDSFVKAVRRAAAISFWGYIIIIALLIFMVVAPWKGWL